MENQHLSTDNHTSNSPMLPTSFQGLHLSPITAGKRKRNQLNIHEEQHNDTCMKSESAGY